MTALKTKEDPKIKDYVESLIFAAPKFESKISFIAKKQAAAIQVAKKLGFPHKSLEDWRYYDFNPILKSNFENYDHSHELSDEEIKSYKELISHHVYPETTGSLLVTINGAYSDELSNLESFDNEKLQIFDFNKAEELEKNPKAKAIVEKHFAENIDKETNFFKAINTAFLQKGFLLKVTDNYTSDNPLQILHISSKNTFNQMRSLIYAGKNSSLNTIVNYIGLEDAKYFTNASIEVILDENSRFKLDKIQNESQNAIQMYNLNASLERDSHFEFNSYTFGAATARDDVRVEVNGKGAHASVNGLYVLTNERRSHNHIVMNHNVEHTTSEQVFKGLLYDKGRGEFNGIVVVKEDAQQVNAEQLNRNLLLSEEAHVDSRPQMDIYADDVKCAHGSTIGQLQEDELFYLQSRGLSKEEATTTLTYSFCEELIHNISLESARDVLTKLALRNLNKGLISMTNSSAKKQCLS